MNEVILNMITRRSIRNYKPDVVDKDIIEQVALAGTFAATCTNTQSPIIIAVTNKEVRDELSHINAEIMGSKSDPFYGAPVVLAVLADKKYPQHVYDGSVVIANMMLAAHSLGVGSCWIHRAKETFERPEGKKILDSLGIKGEYEGIGYCVLGYVEGNYPDPPARKENWIYNID